MTQRQQGDSTFGAAMVAIALFGATFAVGAFAMNGGRAAVSVLFGTGLALGNLYVLGRVIRAMLPLEQAAAQATQGDAEPAGAPQSEDAKSEDTKSEDAKSEKRGSSGAWGVFAVLKVLVLFGLVYFCVVSGWVSLLGFLLGYGALPIGIVTAQLARGMSAR